MTIRPLQKDSIYFCQILNAVLSADGAINSYNCHEFTMIWPTYSAIDVPDTKIHQLLPCKFDIWTNELEYFDPNAQHLIKINLASGTKSIISTSSASQQNWGWDTSKEVPKEPVKPKDPFKKGAILFHKPTRTKWVYDCIDSLTRNHIVRSFYDKGQAMQIFEKNLNEFEELFF